MKRIETIIIGFINKQEQESDNAGDYYIENNTLHIRILKNTTRIPSTKRYKRNRLYEFVILIHEVIEALLCIARNIPIAKIDQFDSDYQGNGEPGDHKDAPYRKEHKFATKVEKMMAKELGIKWNE